MADKTFKTFAELRIAYEGIPESDRIFRQNWLYARGYRPVTSTYYRKESINGCFYVTKYPYTYREYYDKLGRLLRTETYIWDQIKKDGVK
jgi:hypothetical protein